MTPADPFRRAAILALAWCLIGLGIDTGANPSQQTAPPVRRMAVGTTGHFASARTVDDECCRSITVPSPVGQP